MTEAELRAEVITSARRAGILVGITPDSRRAFSGEPDLRLVGRKGVLWAELKDADGELSPAQTRWKWMLLGNGQAWRLWRPRHLEDGTITRELGGIR